MTLSIASAGSVGSILCIVSVARSHASAAGWTGRTKRRGSRRRLPAGGQVPIGEISRTARSWLRVSRLTIGVVLYSSPTAP
ncbi:MAG TPA: hypothetical protein VK357_14530 [Rubrobacteraceae bacterium]|nr:hypothetical protein [Rubrobacteraceae bacterium]